MLQTLQSTALPKAEAQPDAVRQPRLPLDLWAIFLSAPFLVTVYAIHLWKGVPVAYLTQDATTVGNVAWYAGFLSNAGVIFWCAAAALCLFSASLLSTRTLGEELRTFFLASGAFTAFLGLDDLFQFHESVFPRVLGIAEFAVHATYAALALLFAVRFRARIFCWDGRLLLFSMGCLGGSQALDMFPLRGIDPFILEDSFKFLGIVAWFLYFLGACRRALLQRRCAAHCEQEMFVRRTV